MLHWIEKRAEQVIIGDASAYHRLLSRFNRTRSGVAVDHTTALNHSAVWAATDFISSTIAMLPVHLFAPDEDNPESVVKERRPDTPLKLIKKSPNPWMTPFWFKQITQAQAILRGNGYAWIERSPQNKRPLNLWPLPSERTEPKLTKEFGLVYHTTLNGSQMILPSNDVIHIQGFGTDGMKGLDFVRFARESIGLGLAAQEFGGAFFGDGANPRMIVTHPGTLGAEAMQNLRDELTTTYSGIGNAMKFAVFEEGMKPERLSFSNEEAQFGSTRKDNRVEIAGLMRVPPAMIGVFDRATWANAEQMDIFMVKYTLDSWLTRWEEELNTKLLTMEQQALGWFFKFNTNALLRGDINARSNFYKTMSQGIMTPNEIRQKEDLPMIPGFDEPYVPLNLSVGIPSSDDDDGRKQFESQDHRPMPPRLVPEKGD